MCKIISIANQKGGVGKTTTTLNLGTALALNGFKVLLIDLDPQANLSSYLGFEGDGKPTISHIMLSIANNMKITPEEFSDCIRASEQNKISYIPSDINLANAESYLMNALSRELLFHLNNYDYVLIDCLPSLGILLINALTASNNVIIPVQTQKFAFEGLASLTNICDQIRETINKDLKYCGVLATMFDNTNMSRSTSDSLQEKYNGLMFDTVIHKSVEAANSSEKNKSLCLNKTKLGEEYKALAEEVLRRC